MMDIVERLRNQGTFWPAGLANEAANEIERLREALKGLVDAYDNGKFNPMKINGAEWFTARAALKGDE
jgi:hypothetical protein